MSAALPRAMRASSLPSDGSSSASVAPPAAARQSPPTSRRSVANGSGRSRQAWHGSGPRRRLCAIIRTSPSRAPSTAISFFLFKRFASLLLTLAGGVGGRLRRARRPARQRRRGDARRERDARVGGGAVGQARPRPAAARCATATGCSGLAAPASSAPASPTTRRSPQLIAERLAVTVPLALMAMALTTALALVARPLRRGAPQPRRRRRRDGVEPGRHRDPELLVRDPADPGCSR